MNKELLAEWMHIKYEEAAVKVGWKTQDKCQVPFNELPEENKKVMLDIAGQLLKRKDLKLVTFVCPICNYEHENQEEAINCCSGA